MTGRCVGCGRTAPLVKLRVHGAAAEDLGVPDGTTVAAVFSCERCEAHADRERAQINAQHRRLRLRGFDRGEANAIMCRRVDRYFKNGTFVPAAKRAVD